MEGNEDVLKRGVERMLTMINMPDTEDPGRDMTPWHVEMNGKTSPAKSISGSGPPTKRSAAPTSSSPNKRGTTASSAIQVSPTKRTKSKSVSPTKRKVVSEREDEERMEVDEPA